MGAFAEFTDEAVEQRRKAEANLTLRFGVENNPEQVARQAELARRYNLPIDVVKLAPDEFANRAKFEDAQAIVGQSPRLRDWLAQDKTRAEIAHDNLNVLGAMERTLAGTAGDVGVVALKGAMGLPQAVVGLADIPTFGYAGKLLDAAGLNFGESQKIAESMYSPAQQAANKRVQQADGFFETLGTALVNPSTIATSIGESIPQMLGGAGIARGLLGIGAKTLGAGMVGPLMPGALSLRFGAAAPVIAGAAGEGILGAGSAAEQIRGTTDDGTLSLGQVAASIASGAGTGMLSLLGGKVAQKLGIADIDTALASGKLTPAAARQGLLKSLAEGGVSEGLLEELPQSAQEQIWQNLATDRPLMEGVANAAAVGLLSGATMGGGFQALNHIAARKEAQAQQAVNAYNTLQQLGQLSAAGNLRERSPEAFNSAVEMMTENGALQDVYVDRALLVQVFNQSGITTDELQQKIPALAGQLSDATEGMANGMVRIPTADYLTRIAGTEIEQALLPNLRIDPNGQTFAEAQVYYQDQATALQEEADRIVQQRADDQAFQTERQAVHDQVLQQLTAANRFTAEANQSYATLATAYYVTMGERLGMKPTELLAKKPLGVVSERISGEALEQGRVQTDTPEFLNWFGGSKVVDANGAPAIFHHSGSFNEHEDGAFDTKNGVHFGTRDAALQRISGKEIDDAAKNTEVFKENGRFHVDENEWPEAPINGFRTEADARSWVAGEANRYYEPSDYEPDITSVYLSIKNPKRVADQGDNWAEAIAKAKAEGYDGIVYRNEYEDKGKDSYIAFSPEQIKSINNRGTFDPNDANILHQSANEVGANTITGDLNKVNPAVRAAVESRISKLPAEDQQRILQALEEHKSTAWAAAAVKGMAYREMLERAMAGEDISELERNPIWGKQDMAATAIIKAFKNSNVHGAKALTAFMRGYDFVGGNRKAENDISTSFTNCNPSKACAIHCYAAGSNARPNEIAKSEFTEFMIEHFTQEMADEIYNDYISTNAGRAGLALRLNDKGDLSPAQVKLIGLLNDKGVAVQVFSKRPELLRNLSDLNLKMLSIDGTNLDVAAANPDLRLAVTITDEMTEEMLLPIHDRVSVYLPVNLKGHAVTQEELRARFPNLYGRMRKENLCPVDGGTLVTKPGTSFVDIQEGTADKGIWTCTSCDLTGCAGCFKGDRKTNQRRAAMQSVSLDSMKRELEIKKARKELEKQLDLLVQLGGLDEQQRQHIGEALLAGQRDLRTDASQGPAVGNPEGTGATVGAEGKGAPGVRSDVLNQGNRGAYSPPTGTIALLKNADLSTFLHELGHHFLELTAELATAQDAPAQIQQDFQQLLTWFGIESPEEWFNLSFEEKRSYHEQFARGFEAWLFEGNAPNVELQSVFGRFRAWLVNVYKSLTQLNVELTDEVRGVMGRMIASDAAIRELEQVQGYAPLFKSAEAAGMTPEQFAEYQRQGVEATDTAIDDLQGRSLRDMRWASNAKSRMLKALQREAAGKRGEIRAEVAREVWSRPIYQAWQFLTGRLDDIDPQLEAAQKQWEADRKKLQAQARTEVETLEWSSSPEGQKKYRKLDSMQKARAKFIAALADRIDQQVADRLAAWERDNPRPIPKKEKPARVKSNPERVDDTVDSLFVAIAKLGGLDKAQLISEWGLDPKERPKNEVFGKPVIRAEGNGFKLDAMAEMLGEYGYLTLDEHGKHDLREFEEKFFNELSGSPEYSMNADYGVLRGDLAPDTTVDDLQQRRAGRLDSDLIAPALRDKLRALKMTQKDGIAPDLVAELFGFSSGSELVQALASAPDPKAEIDGMTDQRMLEQHGELSDAASIERAAEAAIHNEVRARFMATGLKILTHNPLPARQIAQAASQAAASTVGKQKIRDVRPAQYTAAEARANKNAIKAAASDPQAAAVEQRAALLNNRLARAASDALEDVRRGIQYLKKFDKDDIRKVLDADYVDQIQALLERFELRARSLKAIDKAKGLAAWVDSQREAGIEPDIPEDLLNEANRQHYKDMTVEAFRGLLDTVKQIEHLGRLKHKLLTAADQRAYEAVRDEIAASIEANAQGRTVDARTPTTNLGRAWDSVKRFVAAHRKVAMLARTLDGEQDGGPVWEYFIRNANERGDQETTMRAEATRKLTEIIAPLFKLGKMGGAGQYFPMIKRSLNREARIAIALNVGNEGNLQRLLGGEGWTVAQLMSVLDTITAEEWRVVQQVWDHLESYRPLVGAKERRVYGKEPQWVDAGSELLNQIAIKLQVPLRGGYYPIKYDPSASQRAEEHADAEGAKRQLQGAYTSATTRRSFTKSRAEEVKGRPLLYSLAGLYSGVNDVIHDLAWHEWLIDVNRLLRSTTIDNAIRQHYGPETKQQFKSWIQDIAEGERGAANAGESALGKLRQGVSAAGLGFNVVSAIMQPLGITQSIARIGAGWVASGVSRYIAHPLAATREANAKSDFMMNRARTRFRELNELRNKVQDKSATREAIDAGLYFLMMRCQQAVDVPTWWGAYAKAQAEGNSEERAIALADQAVIDSQGGGMLKDLAAIERGGPALKLFTVFYSFMNTAYNLAANTVMSPASKGRKAANLLLVGVIPAVLGLMLKQAITPGGGDDDWDLEKLLPKLLAAQLDYLMGMMVVVREFAEVAKTITGANDKGRDYQGPAGLRLISDTIGLAKQAHQGEFDDGFRKAAINVIGDLFGLPSAQVNRTITGIEALNEGETNNPAAVVFGFQKPH